MDHNKQWKILQEMGIPDHLTCLLRNLYVGKEATVCCDKHKGFGIVNKEEVDVFLELSHFFNDPTDVGNWISGSSAFSKSSLNIWNFMGHVLLKPSLENFEYYYASM